MTHRKDLAIGMRVKLASGVEATITGEDERGFNLVQVYKGKEHKLTIPFVCLDNPHYHVEILEAPSLPVDVAWIDDNNGAGPQKLSNSIRVF